MNPSKTKPQQSTQEHGGVGSGVSLLPQFTRQLGYQAYKVVGSCNTKRCRHEPSSTARAFRRVYRHMGWGGAGDRHIEVLLRMPTLKKPQVETATACSPVELWGRYSKVSPGRQQCPEGCSTMQLPHGSKSHLRTGLPKGGLS